jgi:bacilliredoxin
MPYPELMITPMRRELTDRGVRELRTADQVDDVLRHATGTAVVAVNSICGCAAALMRPALVQALCHDAVPDRAYSVFAGQDLEATARARSYFTGYPPSSPAIALFKDGKLVFMLQRSDIERRNPTDIAADLRAAFDRFCG